MAGQHNSKVYREQGGDRMVVASGGEIDVESGGTLKVAGTEVQDDVAALAGSAAASLLPSFIPAAVQQAINADGAINLTAYNTAITSVSSTGQAFTLADGTIAGHRKRMQLIVDDGDATVTFNGTATLVFADVGDVAEVVWDGSDWIPVALFNCADGVSGPAYTPAA